MMGEPLEVRQRCQMRHVALSCPSFGTSRVVNKKEKQYLNAPVSS